MGVTLLQRQLQLSLQGPSLDNGKPSPGPSDLGQGSLDRPLKKREDSSFGGTYTPSLAFL